MRDTGTRYLVRDPAGNCSCHDVAGGTTSRLRLTYGQAEELIENLGIELSPQPARSQIAPSGSLVRLCRRSEPERARYSGSVRRRPAVVSAAWRG